MRRDPLWYFIHGDPPPPDWTNEDAVTAWIGHVRAQAFFQGARHDEIDRAEAKALIAAQGIDVPSGIETAQTGSTEGESPVA